MAGAEPMPRPHAVLFACGHNAVRSPMAAAFCRQLLGPSLYVASAGVRKDPLDPFAVAAMDEIGIDITAHEPIAGDAQTQLERSAFATLGRKRIGLEQIIDRDRAFMLDVGPGTADGVFIECDSDQAMGFSGRRRFGMRGQQVTAD